MQEHNRVMNVSNEDWFHVNTFTLNCFLFHEQLRLHGQTRLDRIGLSLHCAHMKKRIDCIDYTAGVAVKSPTGSLIKQRCIYAGRQPAMLCYGTNWP